MKTTKSAPHSKLRWLLTGATLALLFFASTSTATPGLMILRCAEAFLLRSQSHQEKIFLDEPSDAKISELNLNKDKTMLVFKAVKEPTPPPALGVSYRQLKYSPSDQKNIRHLVRLLAEQGFLLSASHIRFGKIHLSFTRQKALLAPDEVPEPPYDLDQVRQEMEAWKTTDFLSSSYLASRKENFTDRPEGHLLSSRSLDQISPGRYAFVRLDGENFLRLGTGHHIIGAGQEALTAGDIQISQDPETGHNQITYMSARSDTYRPDAASLSRAVESLWRQGIFPEHLEFRHWNNEDTLFLWQLRTPDAQH